MINHVTVVGLDAPINLLYGNRSPSEIAYRREVDRRSTPVEVIHTLTQPDRGWSGRTGRIDLFLRGAVDRHKLPLFYVAGPPRRD